MSGMAAFVRAESSVLGLRSRVDSPVRCGVHRHPFSLAVTPPKTFQTLTSFSGQRLTKQSTYCPLPPRRSKRGVVEANGGHSHGSSPGSPWPGTSTEAENILDDISRYIYRKVKAVVAPYFPKDFDPLAWLPDDIHNTVHNIEAPAIILLRELLHVALFYFLFTRIDQLCRTLNWIYASSTDHKDEIEECYEISVFKAMSQPLRLLVVVWAVTRLCHILAPLLKLRLGMGATARIREIGIVAALVWFVLKWKALYVDKLVSLYKPDAPRILAFDKVVSLLIYFVAATCIGEVTGFGLRSLLAVGGFSGVALGLAAKEVVSNFFGGAILFTTRPFVIGERIKTGHFSGYVQDIGFLQTKIVSPERVPMVVPNQNFINQVVTNYSRAVNKLMEAEFPIRMQDIFLVDRITSRVEEYLRSHPEVDVNQSTPLCYLESYNANNNIIAVKCILRSSGGAEFYKVQQAILVHIAEIVIAEGATIGSNSQFGVTIPALSSVEILAST